MRRQWILMKLFIVAGMVSVTSVATADSEEVAARGRSPRDNAVADNSFVDKKDSDRKEKPKASPDRKQSDRDKASDEKKPHEEFVEERIDALFERADTDNDGSISREEFGAAIARMHERLKSFREHMEDRRGPHSGPHANDHKRHGPPPGDGKDHHHAHHGDRHHGPRHGHAGMHRGEFHHPRMEWGGPQKRFGPRFGGFGRMASVQQPIEIHIHLDADSGHPRVTHGPRGFGDRPPMGPPRMGQAHRPGQGFGHGPHGMQHDGHGRDHGPRMHGPGFRRPPQDEPGHDRRPPHADRPGEPQDHPPHRDHGEKGRRGPGERDGRPDARPARGDKNGDRAEQQIEDETTIGVQANANVRFLTDESVSELARTVAAAVSASMDVSPVSTENLLAVGTVSLDGP